MPSSWIFQANPDRYDIDAALKDLDIIHWAVPQYTHQISAGDDVVIWRSGPESGVVGAGKTLAPPSKQGAREKELRFYSEPEEIRGATPATRVPVRVMPVGFLSKSDFADIPELAEHRIASAPMGTVFPLSNEAWEALIAKRPAIGELEDDEPEMQRSGLPTPFAWEDRRKSVYPLPGGYDGYLETLRRILHHVEERKPNRTGLEKWMQETFDASDHSARMQLNFLERASLLAGHSDPVEITPPASHWLRTDDAAFLIGLLHSRIRFVGEMLLLLREVDSGERLLEKANERYGVGWNTRAQIDRRRGWLQSAGFLEVDEENRWQLTKAGAELCERLELADPRLSEAAGEVVDGRVEEDETDEPEAVSPASPREAKAADLADRLSRLSQESDNPDAFEKVVAEAFRFLGFDSRWLGGSGETDVLLVADLSTLGAYRVVVDCKTTSGARITENHIRWISLKDHRSMHGGNYAALVGPAFAGAKLPDHAVAEGVSLINVEALGSLLKQHARIPLGLRDYEVLFSPGDVSDSVAQIAERAEERDREASLAARIVLAIKAAEGEEGPLDSQDLYWLLKQQSEELGDPQRDEIERGLRALSHPGVAVLEGLEDGYGSLGSLRTSAARLRRLARALDGASGDEP
jgi:hypothetical protein